MDDNGDAVASAQEVTSEQKAGKAKMSGARRKRTKKTSKYKMLVANSGPAMKHITWQRPHGKKRCNIFFCLAQYNVKVEAYGIRQENHVDGGLDWDGQTQRSLWK